MKTFACQPWRNAAATLPAGAPLVIEANYKQEAIFAAVRAALEKGLTFEIITADEITRMAAAPG